MTRSDILIFSVDALAAALLGASIELAGYTPLYARDGERPRDALRRIRPAAVLIDCDHNSACSDEFLGPALMTGAVVLLFSSSRSNSNVAALVDRFKVQAFVLPVDAASLGELVRRAVAERS